MLLLALVQQHTATHCNALQHTATHCNTLQHTAAHCSTLQHTATHQSVQLFKSLLAIECAVERDYTVCCSVLQYVAVCCIKLHHATCEGALCSSQKRLVFFTTETFSYTKETHILYKTDQYFTLYSKCIMWHSACDCLLATADCRI